MSMDNPKGKIVSFVDRDDGTRAVVAVDVSSACPRCAAGKGCGAGLFASGDGVRQVEATIRPGLDIAERDDVEISLAPDNLLQAALVVYGPPLLGAVAAAALAYTVSLGNGAAAVAALLGLISGLGVSRSWLRKSACLSQFVPTVERRLR